MSSLVRSLNLRLITAAVGGLALLASAATPASAGFGALPPGLRALYTYTGVRTIAGSVSAVIVCTNLDSGNASMLYEFSNFDGTVVGTEDPLIGEGKTHTTTVSADLNPFVNFATNDQNLVLTADLDMGAVRISSNRKKVICDLQVMDKNGSPPSFIYGPRQYTGGAKR